LGGKPLKPSTVLTITVLAVTCFFTLGYIKGRSEAYKEYTKQEYHRLEIKAGLIEKLTGVKITAEEAEFFTVTANAQRIDFAIKDTDIDIFR
jgi:hypothetical protein